MADRLKMLPTFTCIDDDQRVDLWPPAPPETATYRAANDVGRARAAELCDVVRRTQSPVLLGHVIEAIARTASFGGMEIGFFHALSVELITPVTVTEFVQVPPERHFKSAVKEGPLRLVVNR